jgi:hypothetical protein
MCINWYSLQWIEISCIHWHSLKWIEIRYLKVLSPSLNPFRYLNDWVFCRHMSVECLFFNFSCTFTQTVKSYRSLSILISFTESKIKRSISYQVFTNLQGQSFSITYHYLHTNQKNINNHKSSRYYQYWSQIFILQSIHRIST